MKKLTLGRNSLKGLKIFCKICNRDNPNCKHYENQYYKIRVHIPGTKNDIRSKKLTSKNYLDAVQEATQFQKDLVSNNYELIQENYFGNDFTLVGAILKYTQYLGGNHELVQFRKKITTSHEKESFRFCKYFCKSIEHKHNLKTFRVKDVSKQDVAMFYLWAESHFPSSRTFNKCMMSLRTFFNFLIDIEDINMKNPFVGFKSKSVEKSTITTVSKREFDLILDAIDNESPILKLGGKGEEKNMNFPYLKEGFKLFLLTGGRREEIVDLKWGDIYQSENGTYFFMIANKKVERNSNNKGSYIKYIPINSDLQSFLFELGFEHKKETNDYILFPERTISNMTIMNNLSKSFTFYRKSAKIDKNISLKDLRKTYITWVNQAMGTKTGILTNHSTEKVLKEHYLDPKVISTIEKAVLDVKIFG
jgi:integrase